MLSIPRKTAAVSRENFKKIRNLKITREFLQQRARRHFLSLKKERKKATKVADAEIKRWISRSEKEVNEETAKEI